MALHPTSVRISFVSDREAEFRYRSLQKTLRRIILSVEHRSNRVGKDAKQPESEDRGGGS